jgi:hypothetical protein
MIEEAFRRKLGLSVAQTQKVRDQKVLTLTGARGCNLQIVSFSESNQAIEFQHESLRVKIGRHIATVLLP